MSKDSSNNSLVKNYLDEMLGVVDKEPTESLNPDVKKQIQSFLGSGSINQDQIMDVVKTPETSDEFHTASLQLLRTIRNLPDSKLRDACVEEGERCLSQSKEKQSQIRLKNKMPEMSFRLLAKKH